MKVNETNCLRNDASICSSRDSGLLVIKDSLFTLSVSVGSLFGLDGESLVGVFEVGLSLCNLIIDGVELDRGVGEGSLSGIDGDGE